MAITKKHFSIIDDLNIDRSTVKNIGHVHIGLSGNFGYVWADGTVIEIQPGQVLTPPSISVQEISSLSGVQHAGDRSVEGRTEHVFQSQSGNGSDTFAAMSVSDSDLYVVCNADVPVACEQYARSWSNVIESQDRAMSCSAAAPRYWTYRGRPLEVEDAHDEYELGLDPGDQFSLQYVNSDNYVLKLKGEPKIKFVVKGHKRAQNILSQSEIKNPIGAVSEANDRIYTYEGTLKQDVTRPIRIGKGTDLYSYRNSLYFAYNLKVPVDKMIPQTDMKALLKRCEKRADAKDIANGKLAMVRSDAGKFVPPAPETKRRVFAAVVPVSNSQLHRGRVFVAPDAGTLQLTVQGFMQNARISAPFYVFEMDDADPLYKEAKDRVLIKNTNLIVGQRKAIEVQPLVKMEELIVTEPRDNPPDLTVPYIKSNQTQVLIKIRSLIDEGFFITGIRLALKQPQNGILFEAENMDDQRANMLAGAARRLIVWLTKQGANVQNTITIQRGQTLLLIQIEPKAPRDMASIEKLQNDPPTLNAPIYSNTSRHEPTVEIVDANIHTGMVTVRMQRGPELYAAPYIERYAKIERNRR